MKRLNRTDLCFWLLLVLTATFCLWVLTLPLFPTEDGPVHLYFAAIFRALLLNTSPVYERYYSIQHRFPPYSLQYYVLITMMRWMKAAVADKIFVCLVFVTFAFGLRYLLSAVGEYGKLLGLLVAGLFLNWPLGMGFENFSLSLGLACWALGCWQRVMKDECLSTLRVVGYLVLVALMTLTHAVPLLLVIAFCALDLSLELVASWVWRCSVPATLLRRKLPLLIATSLPVLYLRKFTDMRRTAIEVHQHLVPLAEARHYARLFGIAYFGGASAGVFLNHMVLYGILFVGFSLGTIAAWSQIKHRKWSVQLTWYVGGLLFALCLPFLPLDINGSHLFAERLVIVIWISMLAAGSGFSGTSRLINQSIVVLALIGGANALALGEVHVRPVAKRIAVLEAQTNGTGGMVGLLLPGGHDDYTFDDPLRFYPFEWAGVRFFTTNGDVLLNTPWLDLPIMPLTSKPETATKWMRPEELENFRLLRSEMLNSPRLRRSLVEKVSFILFSDPNRTGSNSDMRSILDSHPFDQWHCEHIDWYVLCEKR